MSAATDVSTASGADKNALRPSVSSDKIEKYRAIFIDYANLQNMGRILGIGSFKLRPLFDILADENIGQEGVPPQEMPLAPDSPLVVMPKNDRQIQFHDALHNMGYSIQFSPTEDQQDDKVIIER